MTIEEFAQAFTDEDWAACRGFLSQNTGFTSEMISHATDIEITIMSSGFLHGRKWEHERSAALVGRLEVLVRRMEPRP